MKIENPPKFKEIDITKYIDSIGKEDVLSFLNEANERYFYWSEIKYRPNIPFKNSKEAWKMIKSHRMLSAKGLYFGEYKFTYNLTSYIQKDLHNFDLKLIGGLYQNSITPQDKREYFKNSLIEEAIASSQIEGAATTTDVAKDMIKSGRKPRNESEQMIVNNFNAIREIENRLEEELSIQLILDIHELMTSNTEASQYSGKFRNHPIYVKNHIDGEIAFTAPDYKEVIKLIDNLIYFINNEDDFIHPIIKASVLHFMIGFIHPFGDGNGRTARALFYWYSIKKGYTLLKHISISKAILNSRTSYDKAFLKTEYDDNDLTYFIMYSMKSLRVAFQNLINYRDKKRAERYKVSELMYELIHKGFNKRQADLLSYLVLKPKLNITISIYSKKHNIVRQTATRDLIDLENKGILSKFKDGKSMIYQLINIEMINKYLIK
ncbi:cell filamentation protein Fic [Tenacibaculum finnmarkense genomovar ulcerans]|uniref:Fic family protein n=1 Tax=Tenacibaculum finnmarkense TaxID=2781243 RepID=UPI00187B4F2B|nr:Fic family protein [Tenacibaculum finnmarkense]MBE7645085.1 cell filamentation protein Fic [Tenacibaculum finnmarkense genomovar ulcerans]